ncbi:MAG: hypothetical protein HYW26_04800 [Candidatus Aenigmarchaeota archaeon]|nr:hypothetical protein [Candidatus Aenigmarchaeota archaeon]
MPKLKEIQQDLWKSGDVEVLKQIRYVQFKTGKPMGIYEVETIIVEDPLNPSKAMIWYVKIKDIKYDPSDIEECFSGWK